MRRPQTDDALAKLAERLVTNTTIVGVGNELRGDDAAGSLLARKLAAAIDNGLHAPTIAIIDCGDVPENYLGPILNTAPSQVVFCDAVDFDGAPGEIRLLEMDQLAGQAISTHNSSLSVFASVLAAEGVADQLLIGIQPKYTSFGSRCSEEVLEALNQITAAFIRYIDAVSDGHR